MRKTLFLLANKCFFCFFLQAQTVEETYMAGCQALQKNETTAAINLLQRTIFFANDSLKISAQITLADCFVINSEYAKAQSFYDAAFLHSPTDSLRNEILFRKAACYILENEANHALEILNQIPGEIYSNRLNFYKGVAWYKMAAFDSSKHYFTRAVLPHKTDSLEILFAKLSKKNRLSPKKARNMSILLPG